jgi:hypothetical protein
MLPSVKHREFAQQIGHLDIGRSGHSDVAFAQPRTVSFSLPVDDIVVISQSPEI